MQDLLNEEEFTQQINYNPWKRFLLFCGFAIIHVILLYLTSIKSLINAGVKSMLSQLLFIILIAMPFIMVLCKNIIRYVANKTVLAGVILLMTIYFLSYVVIDIIINGIYFYSTLFHLKDAMLLYLGFIGYALFSYFFIWLILRYKRKKLQK